MMTSLDDKIAALEVSIARYESMLEKATSEERMKLLDIITRLLGLLKQMREQALATAAAAPGSRSLGTGAPAAPAGLDLEILESIQTAVQKGVRGVTRGIINALASAVPESTAADRVRNQQEFKQNLCFRYNCIHDTNPNVTKCMVLGAYLSTDCVVASHLVSLQDRKLVTLLGFSNIWDGRNGILVHKCIDKKYGNLEITFVPDFNNHMIQLRVLYDEVMIEELKPPIERATVDIAGSGNVTFGDLHLRCLLLPPMVFPFRRAFVRHAKSAYDMLDRNFKPHRIGVATDPLEEEWNQMLELCASHSPECGECEYFQSSSSDYYDV